MNEGLIVKTESLSGYIILTYTEEWYKFNHTAHTNYVKYVKCIITDVFVEGV